MTYFQFVQNIEKDCLERVMDFPPIKRFRGAACIASQMPGVLRIGSEMHGMVSEIVNIAKFGK